MQKNSVLIIDDEKFNIDLAGAYLQEEGYRVLYALSGAKAIEMLHIHKVDLILMDINMPGMDGFEVSKKLKEDDNFALIPIIFLTALNDIESITKAFEIGGADYIVKPFNPLELKARVKTQMHALQLVSELKQNQAKLAQLSISDPFTKLPNALYFESQLKIALKEEGTIWIALLKVDKLDAMNKLYGFAKTNKLLKLFAKLLRESCFRSAKVTRIYGGSFGIIFKNFRFEDVEKNLAQIQKALREDSVLKSSLGIDVVVYNAKKGASLEQIYAKLLRGLEEIDRAFDFNYLLIK